MYHSITSSARTSGRRITSSNPEIFWRWLSSIEVCSTITLHWGVLIDKGLNSTDEIIGSTDLSRGYGDSECPPGGLQLLPLRCRLRIIGIIQNPNPSGG